MSAQRRLLVAIAACIAVFISAFLYATFTSYPSWMWLFVFLGSVVPPPVAGFALALLLLKRWQATHRTRPT